MGKKPSAYEENISGMSICMLTSAFLPHIGGVEFMIDAIANAFSKMGHQVSVVCPDYGEKCGPPPIGNYTVNRLFQASFSSGFSLIDIFGWFIGMVRVFFLGMREKFDVVHAHFVFPSGLMALPMKILLDIPVVVTSHGWDIQREEEIGYGARLNPILRLLISYTLKYIDKLIIVGESMKKDAQKAGTPPAKIVHINNPVNLSRKKELISKKTKFENDLEAPYLLYLGRLHPKKRVKRLVKAFSKIPKETRGHLFIAGEGKEKQDLQKLIKAFGLEKEVKLLGRVSEEEKWKLYENANAFVMASSTEAFGITLLEAMICGTPPITPDTGSFPSIIKDDYSGMLYPSDSRDALTKKMETAFKRRELMKKRGANAKKEVLKRFSPQRIASKYEEIYKEVVEGCAE